MALYWHCLATKPRTDLALNAERVRHRPDIPLPCLIGLAIVVGVFAVNVYRAAHQSITVDEAFTYGLYIDKPFHQILVDYSPNNHILNTLLSRLSVEAFGLSELTFRLPSLLGGLLYLTIIYQLCRHLFRNWWTFLLAVSALTLNPLIMDFLSIARGYGLSLGFFAAALYLVMQFFGAEPTDAKPNHILAAAIFLGLSISANLCFLFPTVSIAVILTLLGLFDARVTGGWRARASWIAARVWLPIVVTAALFVAVPVAHAQTGTFRTDVYGTDSLLDTGRSLAQRSLFHQYNLWRNAIPPAERKWIEVVARSVNPSLLIIVFVTLLPLWRRWLTLRDIHRLQRLDGAYFVIATVLALSLGMLMATRYLFGYLYPLDRTAIYLVVLLTLAWLLLIEKLWIMGSPENLYLWRPIGVLAIIPVALAVLCFLRGFTISYYYEWRFDAGTRRIFLLLQQQRRQFSPATPLKLGVDWRLDFSFNFYRSMYHANWLKRVNRDPREAGGFDYYVTYPEDEANLNKLGLRKIYQDPISDQELLVSGEFQAPSSQSHL